MAPARDIAARGQAHFDRQEYDEAIIYFREAYDIAKTPGLLYNLGQAYRLKGDCVLAATMYRHYLLVSGTSRYHAMVERHLASLDPCVQDRLGGEVLTAVPTTPGRTNKRAGLIIGGAGLAVAGVGTALAIDAMRTHDDEREIARVAMPKGKDDDNDPLAQPGHGDRDVTVATALIAGGLVATAAGATLYYLGWRDEKRAAVLSVAPMSSRGATASLAWRF